MATVLKESVLVLYVLGMTSIFYKYWRRPPHNHKCVVDSDLGILASILKEVSKSLLNTLEIRK